MLHPCCISFLTDLQKRYIDYSEIKKKKKLIYANQCLPTLPLSYQCPSATTCLILRFIGITSFRIASVSKTPKSGWFSASFSASKRIRSISAFRFSILNLALFTFFLGCCSVVAVVSSGFFCSSSSRLNSFKRSKEMPSSS